MFAPGVGIGLKPVKAKRKPFLQVFRQCIKAIATSSLFNSFIMFIIGVNAILIGLETSEDLKHTYSELFVTLDDLFLAIYTAEFLIKVYADTRGYWRSAYNIFDFVILAMSYLQIIMSQLNVGENYLGVFRLLRALRTLRTISFVEGLQVLVTALIDTIRNSVLNVVILLALLMLFFAVVGYYSFGYDASGDIERWGSLNSAMLTLFTFVTADGWTDIQRRLAKNPGSQWFTIVFIFLGHFIFTNLFIGIIIMNIHEATEKFLQAQRQERETQLRLKKEYLYKRQHDDVRQMLEKQKTSHYTNFQEMTKSFYETLRHDDYVITKDVCTNLLWLETYIDSLDYLDLYMYRVQQGHRNLSLVHGELAERTYKKQYGLLISDDLNDRYEPFLNQKQKDNPRGGPPFVHLNAAETSRGRSSSMPDVESISVPKFKRGDSVSSVKRSSIVSGMMSIPSIVIGENDHFPSTDDDRKFDDIIEEEDEEDDDVMGDDVMGEDETVDDHHASCSTTNNGNEKANQQQEDNNDTPVQAELVTNNDDDGTPNQQESSL